MKQLADHPVLSSALEGVWYLAYTKPSSEQVALSNLLAQSYEAWLPLMKKIARGRKKPTDGGLYVMEPMFPRYVFFRPTTAAQSIAPAKSSIGVSKVVTLGQIPGTLTHQQALELANMELAQHELDGSDVAGLKAGMLVVVREGPLKGLNTIVHLTAKERVFLLVQLLGKEHKLAVSLKHIELKL
jgi:transcriptional antiterminator RfaH